MIKGWILCIASLVVLQANAKPNIPNDKDVIIKFGSCKTDYLPGNFQLFIWNIKKGSEKNKWAHDFEYFVPKSHVSLIQESELNPFVFAILNRQKGFCWNFATSFFDRGGNATGVMNGGTIQPTSVRFLRSPGREPVLHTPKMALIEEYALANSPETLWIANIHALNFVSSETNREHIEYVAAYLKNHKGPIIFAGDFNSWNKKRLAQLSQIMAGLKLKKVPLANDNRRLKLDHIFIRGIQAFEAQIHDDIESSDHKPITAVIRL